MTERGRAHLARSATTLTIGPSALVWDGTCLTINLDEVSVPLPRRLRGTVRVYPHAVTQRDFAIDGIGQHRWWPIAPRARIEVDLHQPALKWLGDGYLDHNFGGQPLERAFSAWHWSRASLRNGAAVLYDTRPLHARPVSLALHFDATGGVEDFAPPPLAALSKTRWRLGRETRTDADSTPRILKTLEDTPFYARSMLVTQLLGEPVTAMHESLSLTRFDTPAVRFMLPFRMPRRS